ncbi:MAG TPA: hypothetical protein VKT27_01620 [Candidatus Binataceae bacterium]|nr:hypothetical protein [Candidatus Binataceae bacterium]
MRIPAFIFAIATLALIGTAIAPGTCGADDAAGKVNVDVVCHCPDPVGQNFCATFKQRIDKSVGYELADDTSGYGMGVHLSCVDMWTGIDNKLAGRMSAVSVTFTIYSDKLPGEVFEDSSVFRVGKDKVPDMSEQVMLALGQLISANANFFESMRASAAAGGSAPAQSAPPSASTPAP